MTTFKVLLSSISDVKHFVNAAISLPCDIDVVSGRYVIDAKSIMGIFSIDLSKTVEVQVHGTREDAARFMSLVKEHIVEQ